MPSIVDIIVSSIFSNFPKHAYCFLINYGIGPNNHKSWSFIFWHGMVPITTNRGLSFFGIKVVIRLDCNYKGWLAKICLYHSLYSNLCNPYVIIGHTTHSGMNACLANCHFLADIIMKLS